jgi:hypothetical protein
VQGHLLYETGLALTNVTTAFNAIPILALYYDSIDRFRSGKEVVIEKMIAALVGGKTG